MSTEEEFGRLDKKERELIRNRRRKHREEERALHRRDAKEERDLRRKLNHNDKPHKPSAHKPAAHKPSHPAAHKEHKVAHHTEERALETLRSNKSVAIGETLTITYTLPDKLRFEKITTRGDDDGRLMSIFLGRRSIHRSTNGVALGELKMSNNQAVDFNNLIGDKGDILTITVQASDKDKIIDINVYGFWMMPPNQCHT